MALAGEVWSWIVDQSGHGLALLVASLGGVLVWTAFRLILRGLVHAWRFLTSRRRALAAVARTVTREGAREGPGVWLTRPIEPPEGYLGLLASPKVLAIANLKGGVGKTTISANMGAYFAKEWGKRILLIDLDFQGSLSSMAFPDGKWVPQAGQNALATQLISDDIAPNLVANVAADVPLGANARNGGRLAVITAYYDLAQADNRILVEWLLQTRRRHAKGLRQALADLMVGRLYRYRDVRYTLAEILHSDAVRTAFDLVIIDCPPRLTTSEVQAFCAATHLLIPTILDRASGEAVASLCGQVETLKKAGICPHLEYVGVVGSMVADRRNAQDNASRMISDQLDAIGNPTGLLPPDTFFRRSAHMVNSADNGIAYLAMPGQIAHQEIRDRIETLARYVAGQVGLPPPPNFQMPAPQRPSAKVQPLPARREEAS